MPDESLRVLAPSGTPDSYQRAWETFTRLNRNATGAVVGLIAIPVLTVSFLILSPAQPPEARTELVFYLCGIALAVMVVAVFYTRWQLAKSPCPRCGKRFHHTSAFNQWAIYFQTTCASCGLAVGAVPE